MLPLQEIPTKLLMDGGVTTQIKRTDPSTVGQDRELRSSRVLVEKTDVLKKAHKSYLEAGADLILTNTYHASVDNLQKVLGCSTEKAIEYLKDSVRIAKKAREEFWSDLSENERTERIKPLIGGAIGPYGALLFNGSEFRCDYINDMTEKELQTWHYPRIKALVDEGIDVICVETMSTIKEATAVLALLSDKFPNVVAYVAFSCKDSEHLAYGEQFSEACKLAVGSKNVFGVGINCTNPVYIEDLLKKIPPEVRECKKLVVYPNSGDYWNAQDLLWEQTEKRPLLEYVSIWLYQGVDWIGGCCELDAEDIKAMRPLVKTEKA